MSGPTGARPPRLDRVRARMERAGVALLVVAPGADYRYLAGVTPPYDERLSMLVVGLFGAAAIVPSVNALHVEEGLSGGPVSVCVYTDADGPGAAVAEALRRAGAAALKADRMAVGDDLKAAHALEVLDRLGPGRPSLGSSVVAPERMRKEPGEIAALRRSAAADDASMEAAWAAIAVGATEREVSEAASRGFADAGGRALFTSVAAGANSAEPHHDPGDRALAPGDTLFLDLGGDVDGYQSDLTRMASLGAPTDAYRRVHDLVVEAAMAARAEARPGATCADVDLAARRVIAAGGHGERFVHRTGHGIGLTTHEPPSIVAGNDLALEEGMTFSIEPGVYLPGQFGVRIEDIVVVEAVGASAFSRLPHALHVVG